jgi:hypothetical protein
MIGEESTVPERRWIIFLFGWEYPSPCMHSPVPAMLRVFGRLPRIIRLHSYQGKCGIGREIYFPWGDWFGSMAGSVIRNWSGNVYKVLAFAVAFLANGIR